MLSSRFNFILTIIISIALFIYMKSKSPKKGGSYDFGKQEQVEQTDLPDDHPLKHPKFKLIDIPSGEWADGYIDIHDVLDYTFTSRLEQKYAILRLLEAGYGHGKTDFLYFKKDKITINGSVFESIPEAQNYLKKSAIKKIRAFVLSASVFPKEIKVDGIHFYMIPWDKQKLPEIEL
ncbi:MAG: hypothetical protein NE328_15280 [Lentisphaeraceae bacterium]|nr:hypothetical protein [Lentisphaeraceae bacterium]